MAAAASVEVPPANRKPAVNFSRPRLNSNATAETVQSRPTTPKSPRNHSVQANPPPSQPLDDACTFSDRADRSNLPSSESSSAPLPWGTPRRDLSSQHDRGASRLTVKYQRHPGPPSRNHSHSNEISESSGSVSGAGSGSTAESLKQLVPKGILKHTQVDQYSERAPSEAGDSGGSQHTSSEEGGRGGSWDENGNWTSSDFDTSGLSEKEIEKLKKKGVNPRLYAEMKAVRKGKSCVSGLVGNAYVT